MDLSQQSITGHQFDLNRRGYDPDTVDAHLASIASAVAERQAHIEELERTMASLQAKVQDANESEEALRLTLKAAAHAKEELLARAREQAETMRQEAQQEAESAVGDAKQQAHAITTEAQAQANTMTQQANQQAHNVASAALAESELLVERIEELRAQVLASEEALRAMSADSGPRLESAREALDDALAEARASVEAPAMLAASMPPEPNVYPVSGESQQQTDHVEAPAETGPVDEQAANQDDAPDVVEDTPEPEASAEPQQEVEVVDESDGPRLEVVTEEPAQAGETRTAEEPAAADAPTEAKESTADISDKVDRLLEELREVT